MTEPDTEEISIEPDETEGFMVTRTTTITNTVYVMGTSDIDRAEAVANSLLDEPSLALARMTGGEIDHEYMTSTASHAPVGSLVVDADGNQLSSPQAE